MFSITTQRKAQLQALDSKDDAKSVLVELKKAFTAFEEAHDVVCVPITEFVDQMKVDHKFMDVEQQYTQCLNDINPWLYGANCDVSYAKPFFAINSSAVNARGTGKPQNDILTVASNPSAYCATLCIPCMHAVFLRISPSIKDSHLSPTINCVVYVSARNMLL